MKKRLKRNCQKLQLKLQIITRINRKLMQLVKDGNQSRNLCQKNKASKIQLNLESKVCEERKHSLGSKKPMMKS